MGLSENSVETQQILVLNHSVSHKSRYFHGYTPFSDTATGHENWLRNSLKSQQFQEGTALKGLKQPSHEGPPVVTIVSIPVGP